jgi:hypothetical protein
MSRTALAAVRQVVYLTLVAALVIALPDRLLWPLVALLAVTNAALHAAQRPGMLHAAWRYRAAAQLAEERGDTAAAGELRQEADRLEQAARWRHVIL